MTGAIADQPDPSLLDALTVWLENRLADVHTILPGKVVAFYPDSQSADVQPLLKRTIRLPGEDPKVIEYPQVTKAPVVYPRGAGWRITWPLKAGDLVLVAVGERSLDRWLSGDGAAVAPGDPRKHDLSDAVVLAGLAPYGSAIPDIGTEDLVLGREDASSELRLKPDGTILLGAGADAGVARDGDTVEISPSTAPGFYAALAGALAATFQPPFTDPIEGKISSSSAKVKAI